MDSREIIAAGAVVCRKGPPGAGGPQVLLVHRPKYDDWSFPKGKLDPGEHILACAIREVAEETGLDVRLGPPLPDVEYLVGNGTLRPKRVHYWSARVVGDDGVHHYHPNEEIDELEWLDLDTARERLTLDHDRDTLDEWIKVRKRSAPLLILRHARARSRRSWRGDDRERTLTQAGELQADQLVPLLGAYGVQRVVSSTSRRCWTTVAPYADITDEDLEVTDALSEEVATAEGVEKVVHELLTRKESAVLCTHRPVLPLVLEAAGVADPGLEPGEMLVVHHRNGQVVATERHTP
ncbi:MAG: NUDIX hydrolase [Nocardioides sp.]